MVFFLNLGSSTLVIITHILAILLIYVCKIQCVYTIQELYLYHSSNFTQLTIKQYKTLFPPPHRSVANRRYDDVINEAFYIGDGKTPSHRKLNVSAFKNLHTERKYFLDVF